MGICLAVIVIVVIALAFLFFKATLREKAAKRHNHAAFADFTSQNGWQVIPIESYIWTKEIGERLGCDLSNYSLFKYGTSQTITRAATKQEGNKTYLVFDMHYSWSLPEQRSAHRDLTAVALCAPDLSLPKFALYPHEEKIMPDAVKDVHYPGSDMGAFINNQGIHPLLSYDAPTSLSIFNTGEPPAQGMHAPITFDSHAFSERYILHGKETDAIRRVFDKEKLSSLERLPPTCVDGQGKCLFAFNAAQLVPPEQWQTFVVEKMSVLNALVRESGG